MSSNGIEENGIAKKAKTDHSLNIKELFFKYVRFLPLYVLFVALAFVGAYLYLRYSTEYYRSSGQLLVRDERTTSGPMSDLQEAIQSNGQKNIQAEIEVMQSQPLMERVVNELNLNYYYYSTGKIKELNIYRRSPFKIEQVELADSTRPFSLVLNFITPQSFKIDETTTAIPFGQVFQNEYGKFKITRIAEGEIPPLCRVEYLPTPQRAASLLGGLAVAPKQTTGILIIALETTNPQLSADVLNSLMRQYDYETVAEKNESTQKQLDFIDANIKERQLELDSITTQLVTYQKANNIIDPTTQSGNYFSRVEDAYRQEQSQRLQLNTALQIQDYLRGNTNDPVPSSLGLADPVLNAMVSDYNKTQLDRKRLLENAGPRHVIVQQKDEEIALLRNKILENVKNIRSSYNQAIGTLQSSSGEALSQIKTLPNKTQELQSLQNQIEGKMKLYNEMLANRDLSAIKLASTISNTKVMQEALPNSSPVKPNRRNTQILAVFIGLLIPTIIIVIIELLNDKVNSRSDVERLTDATVLGEVGHSPDGRALVVTTGNRRVIAEQFRILRSNLQYVLTKAPKPVIMITSSFSGEGKSFVSTNMGAVMALANRKTIILEFDIRKPKIVSGLEMPKQRGLSNYILGEIKAEELPVPVKGYDNLFILPCGPIPPNPGELLLDGKLDELFVWLRQAFDVVIMDTAPVGMVSDALTLSKYADCTLYIVRQKHTFKKQISLIQEYFEQGKLPKVSVVLNDVKLSAGYGNYGYGGSYGYGYGYGSGYFEEEPDAPTRVSKWLGWIGMSKKKKSKSKKQSTKA